MTTPLEALATLDSCAAETLGGVFGEQSIRSLDDRELLELVSIAARVARRLDAVLIETAGEVASRSAQTVRDERLSTRMGCHNVSELLQRATRFAPRTVAQHLRAATAVRRDISVSSGEALPARFPSTRDALLDGFLGVDGVLAVADPLTAMGDRVDSAAVLFADARLAEIARGEGADAAPPACAADLKMHAQALAMILDADGAEPREAIALRRRGLRFGTPQDGVIPISGMLLPDVFAQFQRIADSLLTPRVGGPAHPAGPHFSPDESSRADRLSDPLDTTADIRTRAQQLHDVLATTLGVAARSGDLPSIGGAAPTLVVSARAEDLVAGTGYAHVDGTDEPVSIHVAEQTGCSGSTQRVLLDDRGRIVSIQTTERVFNHHQRKAISLRDGGCVIPGCHVPAAWCEIHHVTEHSRGGETHTDNGVLLCWIHHRTLATNGWAIRMNRGVPEVRGPAWWDPLLRWRAATTSRSRLVDNLRA